MGGKPRVTVKQAVDVLVSRSLLNVCTRCKPFDMFSPGSTKSVGKFIKVELAVATDSELGRALTGVK